jgi:ferrochelatase
LKLAVVLFNLGGPDSLDAVRPFLENLFSDPAILAVPALLRRPLAKFIAARRAPFARDIYKQLGGKSPITEKTEAQARALEAALARYGHEVRAFIAMRAWRPFTEDAVRAVVAWQPGAVVLLPLYPQFSTTTSGSSVDAWTKAAARVGLSAPQTRICCYPWDTGFVSAEAALLRIALAQRKVGLAYRILFSAHGLPKYVVARGDPYQWQVERTVEAIVRNLGSADLDWRISYQSRVGPLEWLGPATDAEIRLAGAEGKGLIVAPVAFVSEHSETLVELDIEYAKLARESGVSEYLRVATVGTGQAFIEGLAELVLRAVASRATVTCGTGRICPKNFAGCGFGREKK